jgi:hypothetical protein
VKVPFWIHQLVEYGLGLALLLQAPRADTPLLLLAAGAGVIILAGTAKGPLAAWHGVDRRTHRRLDIGAGVLAIVVAAVFWSQLGFTSGATLVVVALFLLLLATSVDTRERRPRARPALPKDSEDVGRAAGRVVARGMEAYRRRKRP